MLTESFVAGALGLVDHYPAKSCVRDDEVLDKATLLPSCVTLTYEAASTGTRLMMVEAYQLVPSIAGIRCVLIHMGVERSGYDPICDAIAPASSP